jgi:hypothetical protein
VSTPAVEVPDGRTLIVAGRPVPWAQVRHEDLLGPDRPFRIRQALVPFENGWAVSVIWGSGAYSDNYGSHWDNVFTETPARVEAAVLGPDGMIEFPRGDVVSGYVPGSAVLELIDTVARWPSGTPGPWPAWWTDDGSER